MKEIRNRPGMPPSNEKSASFESADVNSADRWDAPAIGLMDLDAFFASVEQLDHPDWRGKPVIVGGSPHKRGVVSTASYEARTFGVHSAMPSATAARLCPQAIWTSGSYARYKELSQNVMSILLDETPLVEQVSIDEAFFDVTPGRFSREHPIEICRRIQRRVAELGITCSIGLGVNKTVAKIASEREKPRGLTVVLPGSERRFLAPLPVETMSGIGPSTAKVLHSFGIKTLGELSRANTARLEGALGVSGPRLIRRAGGLEMSVVSEAAAPSEAKSVSNERTFKEDLTDETEIRGAIRHISCIVGRRLRKNGLKGCTVTLKVKNSVSSSHTAQKTLSAMTDQEDQFGPVAEELLQEVWHNGQPVRLLGVGVSGFDASTQRPIQPVLFDEQDLTPSDATRQGKKKTRSHRPPLSGVTDALKDKFGSDVIKYGRDLRFEDCVSDTMPMGKSDV